MNAKWARKIGFDQRLRKVSKKSRGALFLLAVDQQPMETQ